jgi:hypothetical protein
VWAALFPRANQHRECFIIQNNNAYEVGFSEAWDGFRHGFWLDRNETNENAVASLLELETVKPPIRPDRQFLK